MLHAPRFANEMGLVYASHFLQRARRTVLFHTIISFLLYRRSMSEGWAGHVTSRDR